MFRTLLIWESEVKKGKCKKDQNNNYQYIIEGKLFYLYEQEIVNKETYDNIYAEKRRKIMGML